MKSRKPFGKPGNERASSPPRMSPMLQAMSAELPKWPPEKRRILERIIIKASAKGVSSMKELSAFLDAHPDLRSGFFMMMAGGPGPLGNEMRFPTQPPEQMSGLTITGLGEEEVNISSPEEMESFLATHPQKSIEMHTTLLEDAQVRVDRFAEGVALGELGLAYARLNQLPKAIYYFERHLGIARELGNWQWEMEDCRNLGRAHLQLGDDKRALAIYEDALRSARRQGDRQWIINHSFSLASIYTRLGDLERAAELATQAAALRDQGGS